ncbi:MAG: membrane protein insertase YidC [Candidatus Omnitrophota bacterium]
MNIEKRLILALLLSVVVVSAYSLFLKGFYKQPIVNKDVTAINNIFPEVKQAPPPLAPSSKKIVAQKPKPLGGIAKFLLSVLKWFQGYLKNWGLSIVALSVAIWLVLYPLSMKSLVSAKQMQTLQPKIEALRQQYKDQPQKLNKEIFELYRQNKVNPMGGCLPLVPQMFIFFGLYQMLTHSNVLQGAGFLWIKDLASTDKFYTFPPNLHLTLIKNELNILPLLMAALMFVQQKLSSKSTAGVSSEQQKIMLIVFPLMFGVMFYNFPSGLVLYWTMNSVLMILQQIMINRAPVK